MTIAFRSGAGSETRALAARRNDDRHLGGTLGTPLALVSGDAHVITRSDRLSTTGSERQHQFQPVY